MIARSAWGSLARAPECQRNLETYTFVADLDFHEANAAAFRLFFTPEVITTAFQQVLQPMFQLDD